MGIHPLAVDGLLDAVKLRPALGDGRGQLDDAGQLVQQFHVCGAGEQLRLSVPAHFVPALDDRKLDVVGVFDQEGVPLEGDLHAAASISAAHSSKAARTDLL